MFGIRYDILEGLEVYDLAEMWDPYTRQWSLQYLWLPVIWLGKPIYP